MKEIIFIYHEDAFLCAEDSSESSIRQYNAADFAALIEGSGRRVAFCFYRTRDAVRLLEFLPALQVSCRNNEIVKVYTPSGATLRNIEALLYNKKSYIGKKGLLEAAKDLSERRFFGLNAWSNGREAQEVLNAIDKASAIAINVNSIELEDAQHLQSLPSSGLIYQPYIGEIGTGVYGYDVKSAYPFQSIKTPLPLGFKTIEPTGRPRAGVLELLQIDNTKRNCRAIDITTKDNQRDTVSYWATDEDIENLIEDGTDFEPIEAVTGTRCLRLFGDFTQKLFSMRARVPLVKGVLNACTGSLYKKPLRIEHCLGGFVPRDAMAIAKSDGLITSFICHNAIIKQKGDEYTARVPFFQPLAAATILGHQRARMFRVKKQLEKYGHDVLYIDTDSVHTTANPSDFADIVAPLGSSLGDFALEFAASHVCYVAPKIYAAYTADKLQKVASAGVPLDLYNGQKTENGATVLTLGGDGLSDGEKIEFFRMMSQKKPVHLESMTHTPWQRVLHGDTYDEQPTTVKINDAYLSATPQLDTYAVEKK